MSGPGDAAVLPDMWFSVEAFPLARPYETMTVSRARNLAAGDHIRFVLRQVVM
ncbi:MAG: hypothetical protein JWQ95_6967 [Sphaerisporangium sp.]|jgi:hypothetical protein|nr:hypothetical protein [Sphaerisporangium sp.]